MSEEIEKEEVEVKEPTEAEKILSGDYIPEGDEEDEEKEAKEKIVEKEIDPAVLEKIAKEEEEVEEPDEEKEKKGWVPSARLREEIGKRQELEAELKEERSKKTAEEPAKADGKESLRELIKRRNDAQTEGEDVTDLDIEIIEKTSMLSAEAIKKIKDEAKAEIKAEAQAEKQATLQEKVSAVAEEAFKTYPFLSLEADIVNNKAINEVKDKRDEYCKAGIPVDEALKKAIEEIGPKYLEKEDGKDKKGEREREAKRKNADASLRQPPSLNASGNRGKGEPETDPAKMSRADHTKWWASLSETERQRQLGNIE